MPNGNKEFTPKGEDVIREEVIKDFDLKPEDHEDLIKKLTSERMENQKKLSKAIEQKIDYRNAKDFYKQKAEPVKPGEKKEAKTEIDESKFVTKEEFEKTQRRNQYSYLTNEEFDFVNALAKGTGKKFEECLDEPIVKEHLESNEAQTRIAGATGSPSTRFKTSSEPKEKKIAKEFDKDYPVGFAPKKN
jgi:tRNA U34 5-carboxymethylaminomethyl modifying enzyme MnmG/GidA